MKAGCCMRGLSSCRIHCLFLLFLLMLNVSFAGLRDLHPRPQQMGLLSEQPILFSGTPYLVVPDNPTADEILARDEAVRLINAQVGSSPSVITLSEYNGQGPAILFGVLSRFPALTVALDSTGIPGLGAVTRDEEYQLVVQDGRILLGAADTRGLRWGAMSLAELMSAVMGQVYVDQAYIRDWPDFQKRIGTINSPLRMPEEVSWANLVADRSYTGRMNEMECNLSESGNRNAYPVWIGYLNNLASRIRNRGQTLTMSTDATAHNVPQKWWQEGIPMRGTMMRVTSTGFVPVSDGFHVSVPNGGFESWTGARPTGWQMGNDSRYMYVSRDATTMHSGSSSVKFSGLNDNSPSDVEMWHDMYLGPDRLVKVKFWYKMEGFRGQILANMTEMHEPYNRYDNRLYTFDSPTTQDWTLAEFTFCTFNADTGVCMIGPWYATAGTLWLDDITFETADLVNMIRRSDTPLTLTKQGLPLSESVDYRVVETNSTSYPQYVMKPRLERVAGGMLSDGDTVRVDWYSAVEYQGGRQTDCFSLLEPLLAYQDRIAFMDSLLHPDEFKIHINEVSYAGYDDLCTSRHMTPAQLVGSRCNQMYQIIQGRRPGAPVRIYGDAFDIFVDDVRAMPVTSRPWTVGALQELPQAIEVMAMQGYSDNLDSSITYFNNLGHSSVTAVQLWYPFGIFPEAIQASSRHPQECKGVEFYMWPEDGDPQLEHKILDFGDLAWNIGPYIEHSPLYFSSRPDTIQIYAQMWSDTFHQSQTPFLTSTTLYYRWLPGGSYTTAPLVPTGGETYRAALVNIPPSATGLSYYLSVSDQRGETSTAPADAPQRVFTVTLPVSSAPEGGSQGQTVTFSTRAVPGGTLLEWSRSPGVDWYEVHVGAQADFSADSRTRISTQQPVCPRYLVTEDRADAVLTSVKVYGFSKASITKNDERITKR